MLKQLLSLLLLCAMLLLGSLATYATPTEPESMLAPPSLSAHSAILTDPDGNVLFEKNGQTRMGPASTTKLMTALVVAEACAPDTVVTVPREAVGIEGSSIYLKEGESLTVEQLLYALLLASANDAATALALFCADSEEAFCEKMNEKAAALGLADTHFVNPHGLAHDDHYTTAHDLAVIAACVLRHPLLRKIVSTYKTTIPLCGTEGTRVLVNHNKLLRLYDGAIGLKTGFTKKTGRTLVSAAERDGLLLIAVTLDAPNDWKDHTQLLDYGFSRYVCVPIFASGASFGTLPVCGGREDTVTLVARETVYAVLPRDHDSPSYAVEATGHFLYAPLAKEQSVARGICRVGNRIYTAELVTAHAVSSHTPKKVSFWERITHFFTTDEPEQRIVYDAD